MKIYFILILLFGALMFSTTVSSQNIQTSTIEWNCNSIFMARPGTTTNETTKVISSSNQVIWYDSVGVAKKTLSISETNGSWNNVSSNGSISFNVTAEEDAGMIQFLRSEGVTRIRIHLITGEDSQIYELIVDSLHAL